MLVVIQVHVRSPQDILMPILWPRIGRIIIEQVPTITPDVADLLVRLISKHLLTINITHRVAVYATNHEAQIIFLRLMDPFPDELVSTLVSLLATQEITPPMVPPEPLPTMDW